MVLHAALFFSTWAVAGNLAVATTAHVVAVWWHGELEVVAPQIVAKLAEGGVVVDAPARSS